MCGILGIFNLNYRAVDIEDKFKIALNILKHRGPDNQNYKLIESHIILGHTRLSIIDVSSASNQPMSIDDRYWVTFNGEIYNYIELRDKLKKLGVIFFTNGDTEVLVRAYQYWGEKCVNYFNGMWAFAIYDKVNRSLFCSRDRFGEKPFNYAVYDGNLIFSSEIKSLLTLIPELRVPNHNIISNFCRTSVGAQQENTWFKGINRLMPGHNLSIINTNIHNYRYWDYPQTINNDISFIDACDEYKKLFNESVKIRLRSDVPIGITLSAGIDSNSILFVMNSIKHNSYHAFTSRFKPSDNLVTSETIYRNSGNTIDESITAIEVSKLLKLNSHVVETDYTDFVDNLKNIIFHLESGNSSPAVFPLMKLLNEARKYVKVIMDGQGADELLAGYVGNLFTQNIIDLIKKGDFNNVKKSITEYKNNYRLTYSILMALRIASNRWPQLSRIHQKLTGIDKVFGPLLEDYKHIMDFPAITNTKNLNLVESTLRQQHTGGLVNLLHYGDAISMANSIESRLPFLDYRLVEFVSSLPTSFKINGGIGKFIHRNAMAGIVPDFIIKNKVKFGFNSPVSIQFRKSYKNEESPNDILLSRQCLDRGLFNKSGLEKIIRDHVSLKKDYGPLLFRLLSVELWYRVFIDNKYPSYNG
jgi:asparagine synthase (glutamine-hydrolysing)